MSAILLNTESTPLQWKTMMKMSFQPASKTGSDSDAVNLVSSGSLFQTLAAVNTGFAFAY